MYTCSFDIHIYMQALDSLGEQLDVVYALVMHEIIHALGFSSSVFSRLV